MEKVDTSLTPFLGRLMLAAIFIWSGLAKLHDQAGTIGYFQHDNIPLPQLAYYVSVAVEVGGGALLILGLFTRFAAVILAIWCLVTAAVAHYHPNDLMQMINLYKNLAMAGGFLYVAGYGAGDISIDALLFRGRRRRRRGTAAATS